METLRLTPSEAGEVLTLQLAAWVLEAIENDTLAIPALHESLAVVQAALADPAVTTWGARDAGRLIGMVRTTGSPDGVVAHIGRLGVVPDRHGQGLGGMLLALAEQRSPASVTAFDLFTGAGSTGNHRFYERRGYRRADDAGSPPGTVAFTKARAR